MNLITTLTNFGKNLLSTYEIHQRREMKNLVKVLLNTISMISLILTIFVFSFTVKNFSANGNDPYNYGAMDSSIPIIEKSIKNGDSNEIDTYEGIVLMNGFSTEGIERLLNDGFLIGYLEQIKAKGLIPQSFVPKSSTTSTKPNTTPTIPTTTPTTPTKPKTSKHTHTYTQNITTAPTCTLAGVTTFTCACGNTYTEEIPLLGHDFKETARIEATCENKGEITQTCTRCGEVQTQVTEALGHDYKELSRIDATCDKQGKIIYKGSRCDKQSEEPIPCLGHKLEEWKTIQQATWFKKGKEVRYCSVCKKVVETKMHPQQSLVPLGVVVGVPLGIAALGGGLLIVRKKKRNT